MCDFLAVRSINFKKESYEGKTAPAVELKIHVYRHPAAVCPFAEHVIQTRSNQKRRN